MYDTDTLKNPTCKFCFSKCNLRIHQAGIGHTPDPKPILLMLLWEDRSHYIYNVHFFTIYSFSFVKKHDKEDQRKTVCDEWSHQTGIGQATDWITILHQPNSRIRCPHVCLTKRHFVQGLTHYSVHVRRTHGLNAKSQKDKEPTAGVRRFPKYLVPIIFLIIFQVGMFIGW